jgi:hypothetical protein
VPQVLRVPIDLEPQMIVRVHHLMRHRVLHLLARLHVVGAQLDPVRLVEAALHARLAAPAVHVVFAQVAAQLPDVVAHEANDGRVLQQPVALRLAPLAVDRLVPHVRVVPVLLLPFRRHAARRHAVEVAPARPRVAARQEVAAAATGGFGGVRALARCHFVMGRVWGSLEVKGGA